MLELHPYQDKWHGDDPYANFKAEVANYTVTDPLPTLEVLSQSSGIPLPCLVRYVLVKWASSGAEALMSMPPITLTQMQQRVDKAEEEDTDEARLYAYKALREIIAWLQLGMQENDTPSTSNE